MTIVDHKIAEEKRIFKTKSTKYKMIDKIFSLITTNLIISTVNIIQNVSDLLSDATHPAKYQISLIRTIIIVFGQNTDKTNFLNNQKQSKPNIERERIEKILAI